jgi:hypothetical protein
MQVNLTIPGPTLFSFNEEGKYLKLCVPKDDLPWETNIRRVILYLLTTNSKMRDGLNDSFLESKLEYEVSNIK